MKFAVSEIWPSDCLNSLLLALFERKKDGQTSIQRTQLSGALSYWKLNTQICCALR